VTKKSLRKLVGGCLGSNNKADGKATSTPNPEPVEPVVPDNPPVYLTRSRRYWSSSPNVGECEISVEVDHWEDPEEDSGPMVILEMCWIGAFDAPDEWSLRWVHFLDYLGTELPRYLEEYSPAPKEMLYQLISGLEPKYAGYFEPGLLAELKEDFGETQPLTP
jgi:hypothetical protein